MDDSVARTAPRRQGKAAGRRQPGALAQIADYTGVLGSLTEMIWRRKLWWMIPLLLAVLLMAGLMFLQATPAGPLVYPMF